MIELKTGVLLHGGDYRIEKVLGQGGFGITYLAEQSSLGRKVCIKEFFLKEYCDRDEATSQVSLGPTNNRAMMEKYQAKFLKEARMIARLDHPNIIRILDVFAENNTAYYVMDYIEGKNLNDIVKEKGALPEAEAVSYICQIGKGLAYIHSHNINHLDIKPGNILVRQSDNRPILIDFGVSKQYDESGDQTSSTPIGVSAGYAPLEMYQSGGVSSFSPQTDIYELGATLYRLVTGKVPPTSSDIMDDGLPASPGNVSKDTWNSIEQAMQPRRKDRPKTVDAFISLLDRKEAMDIPTTPVTAASSIGPIVHSVNEATVIIPKVEPKPRNEPKPAPKPQTPESVSSPVEKKNNLWLFVLLGGIAAAAIIVAFVLGGRRESQAFPPERSSTATPVVHDYVDLGLSVKWATCNVGATSPEDYGSYFAWGETRQKGTYTLENYKFRTSGYSWDNVDLGKYNTLMSSGMVDNKKRLDISDDAARQNWGGIWRMPTDAEMTELREKCKWEWTTLGGRRGYRVTSKKNGNSIFLPAAGYQGENSLYDVGSCGHYWSSSLSKDVPSDAWRLLFDSGGVRRLHRYRCYGFSVRPVTE